MKKIILENFKCFKYEEFNFENLTVLAGQNGSGKSTLIQSILLHQQTHDLILPIPRDVFKRLLLNGYYFDCGTAKSILCAKAENDLIKMVFVSDENTEYHYEYIFNNDENRILERSNFSTIRDDDEKQNDNNLHEKNKKRLRYPLFGRTFDYISADRFGPRMSYEISYDLRKRVGKFGEYAPSFLKKNQENIISNKLKKDKYSTKSSSLLTEVNNWLSIIIEDTEVEVDEHDLANISILKFTNYPKTELDFMSPLNMPFGASYVLPILVSCLCSSERGMIIIENPESHLHPKAQSKLGQFLSQVASTGRQIIIETHSDHIINGIRIAVKKEIINNENVIFNFFTKGKHAGDNTVEKVIVDKNGKISKWPEGFFDQFERDMLELL